MASMRDIKRRKSSVTSTQQITKAMKLVSTVKLQKARARAEETAPYFDMTYKTVSSLLQKTGPIEHPYLTAKEGGKVGVIVITSNRGLAGGYNSNVVKLLTSSETLKKEDVIVYALGKKGAETLRIRGYEITEDDSDIMEAPAYDDAIRVCNDVLEAYESGEIREIYLAYTHFKNTVSQIPTMMKLLPVEVPEEQPEEETKGAHALMNFEPSAEEALTMIIPKYLTSVIFGALMEAAASENGARMQAMDSATNNAEEIINDLTLKYNRARQGSITSELTEIIAGADAIS